MNRAHLICTMLVFLAVAHTAEGQWQRTPASDTDKEFISGDAGLQPGTPPQDRSCWMAAASNMLAGAGYGNGATIQARAEDIYLDMITWQATVDPTNVHGVRDGGWMDNALGWWLGSPHNVWTSNPYTVVTVYGNTDCTPWGSTSGPRFMGNALRDYKTVSVGIRWPSAGAGCSGGHALTPWGDSGTAAHLGSNPGQIIVADSDRDNGGAFQTYTYDDFTNPNPSGSNEGNGWYMNFSTNHAYIVQAVTLSPTDSPIDPHDGPTQRVIGSYRIHQNRLEEATDLHYTAYTDYNILGYRTEIDWPTANEPAITESDTHYPHLTRSDIHVDWDLSDHPVPYCKDVTITTEFILQNWNGIRYDDVYFTYPGGQRTKYRQPPYDSSSGTDIRVDGRDGVERMLADDFPCNRSGLITKVYLWGSWKNDSGAQMPPGVVKGFHLRIYSDDPVGDDPLNPRDDPENMFSKPLELLWSGDFTEFTTSEYGMVQEEYFWDSYTGEMSWDNRIWSYVIPIPEDEAFEQKGTPRRPLVYWLAVSADVEGRDEPEFGWKTTSPEHAWNDAAVMWTDNNWKPLIYPANHRLADRPVDMSFGIVTAGGSPGPGFPEFGWNIVTPEVEDPEAPDITGGYVVGAFDVYDMAGEPTLAGQYRFVHQYPYNQNPEHHIFTLEGPTDEPTVCANFDDLPAGARYHVGDVFTTQGYTCECREFFWLPSGGTTGGYARVHPAGLSGGVVQELELNNINVEFDFGGPVECVSFLFGEYGGNLNLEVNGDFKNFQNFAQIDGTTIGGCNVTVTNGHGNDKGRVVIAGPVQQFTVGGQELRIDEVCPFCDPGAGCRYAATNFRFGHSYGLPDSASLWRFNGWMTTLMHEVSLCAGQPLEMELDWEGRLPYPHSNIVPADEILDPPACTVYLDADLNRDCCVDARDFALFAEDWLECTVQ